jgi:hypothetical protein
MRNQVDSGCALTVDLEEGGEGLAESGGTLDGAALHAVEVVHVDRGAVLAVPALAQRLQTGLQGGSATRHRQVVRQAKLHGSANSSGPMRGHHCLGNCVRRNMMTPRLNRSTLSFTTFHSTLRTKGACTARALPS